MMMKINKNQKIKTANGRLTIINIQQQQQQQHRAEQNNLFFWLDFCWDGWLVGWPDDVAIYFSLDNDDDKKKNN